jgi:hypothetical protein
MAADKARFLNVAFMAFPSLFNVLISHLQEECQINYFNEFNGLRKIPIDFPKNRKKFRHTGRKFPVHGMGQQSHPARPPMRMVHHQFGSVSLTNPKA